MSVGGEASQRLKLSHRKLDKVPLSESAAHEINNPLDSLLTLLYLLETEATFTKKGRHYLTLAKEEVRRISKIAHETLDGHKVVITPESRSVGELLAGVLAFYKQTLESSGISVQTRYCCDSKLQVYTGPLRQVFSNLLLNAVDAMPDGGQIQARVSAGHEWSGQERNGIRVTIADNGSGMSPHILSRIFRRHFTTKPAGHGMGLSVVKEIVQKHRGRLRVRSNTHRSRHGTVFILFLPAG